MNTSLGKFKVKRVADGDTITINKSPMPQFSNRNSLRLLNIDTEETENPKIFGPVTDFAKDVTKRAKELFESYNNEVELKVDDKKMLVGYFSRPLVHVFLTDELHYQKYAIEEGWSPYYYKYGYSEDYNETFLEAEKKAKENKKGIWSPEMQNRSRKEGPYYSLLQDWWKIRADEIEKARKLKKEGNLILNLLNGEDYDEAYKKAEKNEDGEIFGELSKLSRDAGTGLFEIKIKKDLPFYVYISKSLSNRNDIIKRITEKYISSTKKIPDSFLKPNFAFIKGKLELYNHYNKQIPEIVIENEKQINLD